MIHDRQLLIDLFRAYFDARKNKRKTVNALRFELNFETELFKLYEEILSGTYRISRSICFISFHPVKREIFAGDFRDRIVHHLIFNYLNPLFERVFIADSYSCRTGRGTAYGVNRLDHFIRSCSQNYTRDCYILKLDIQGYFMAMNREILYQKVTKVLASYRSNVHFNHDLILWLVRRVIFHDPTKHCFLKGKREDWFGLPKTKSLFFAAPGEGLPIGNLTSQLFGNVYLNDFDHFVKLKLGCRFYGRYVDDFVIVHEDKDLLKTLIPQIGTFLSQDAELELHPNKIYLQHYTKGVLFLGTVVKPYRRYISNRTKGNWYRAINLWQDCLTKQDGFFSDVNRISFLASMNSYFGIMRGCHTLKLRKKIGSRIAGLFQEHVRVSNTFQKVYNAQ